MHFEIYCIQTHTKQIQSPKQTKQIEGKKFQFKSLGAKPMETRELHWERRVPSASSYSINERHKTVKVNTQSKNLFDSFLHLKCLSMSVCVGEISGIDRTLKRLGRRNDRF